MGQYRLCRRWILDRIGANYGVDRQGAEDIFYRLMIKVKMLAQLSGGDTNTILNAASILMGVNPNKIFYQNHFPAKLSITIPADDLPDNYLPIRDIVAKQIKRVMVAGVGFILYIKFYDNFKTPLYTGMRNISHYSKVRLVNNTYTFPASVSSNNYTSEMKISAYTNIKLETKEVT